jgi:adenine-specific DNA-methyltransferase
MMNLEIFNTANLFEATTGLFHQLGIKLNSNTAEELPVKKLLEKYYKNNDTIFNDIDKTFFIGIIDDTAFNTAGISGTTYSTEDALKQGDNNYEGLMLFALELRKQPTRTEISNYTRAFNKISQKMPIALVLKYQTGEEASISIAISERFKYKQNWRQGEKVGKVIILRDIHTNNTHTGHKLILNDLKKHNSTNYEQLHTHWLQVLDVNVLNKKFFEELANWYFWAMDHVKFPDDLEKKEDIRNATNLIRLITRVIFIWFIKEKSLVPNQLFKKVNLEKILKDFNKNENSVSYYQAILQNLFFGALNQKIEERKFARFDKDGDRKINEKEYGVKNLFRYPDLFNISEKEVMLLFNDVPFLNGGLFDCLDKPNDENHVEYVDGFSRNPDKQASVPDYLFFDEGKEVNLTKYYNPNSKKPLIKRVKGLVEILERYKFTIAENTPVEEEIALDPELLGKVFENLLANYNPETQSTARKQTGSFYTPREIVNYMVEESLIEYLKQNNNDNLPDFEVRLRELFSYSEKTNPFYGKETKDLIAAINNCKIIDPACGSGAFPMGILHKMVHILTKLDPNNELWKAQQRENLIGEQIRQLEKDREAIKGLNDKAVRGKAEIAVKSRLKEIDEIFNKHNNFDNYARKLFLIENCIYGVDIQPIAVQISKLRFFISLVIDQNKIEGENNSGIRSLPNLETKFVAANTLISLDEPQLKTGDIFIQESLEKIKVLIIELKEIRHKYFSANNRSDKNLFRTKDEILRQKISDELINVGHEKSNASKIAAFDPYGQNTFANWFNSKWMFGMTGGFDIVIGNPPYGVSIKGDYRILVEKNLGKVPDYEIYYYFIEVSKKLLRNKGVKTYIVPNTFLFNVYASEYRKKLLNNWDILCLCDCTEFKIFEGATVHNAITLMANDSSEKKSIGYKLSNKSNNFIELSSKPTSHILKTELIKYNQNWALAFKLPKNILELISHIKKDKPALSTFFPDYSQGLIAYDKYRGQDETIIKNRVFHSTTKKAGYKKWLRGEDVIPYVVRWNEQEYINYTTGIANPRDPKYFNGERILIREITNPKIYAGLTIEESYNDPAIINILPNRESPFELKSLLAILNSNLATFYHFNSSPKATKGSFPKILIEDIKNFPLPHLNSKDQKPMIVLVDKILSAKIKDPKCDTSPLEKQIDTLVYKLYELTEEEIKIIEEKK